ncbi:MAG: hypothetical protein DMF68_05505 [Acidobacteria bacterium]|nr:MAG: hypothetical protein DMF68_05505 [Acidobacteriota bacterium]
MSTTPGKNPAIIVKWIIICIVVGICLGIITAFIVLIVNIAKDRGPITSFGWTLVEANFIIWASIGALLGLIIGFFIGLIKWAKVD